MSTIYRTLFYAARFIGRPIGGIRPRRIYGILGRRAFTKPEFAWMRNRWGSELLIAPFYHIDRDIVVFGCYDPDLHQALETLVKPGMICLDVGANLGEVALHMALRTGPAGKVFAFEPVSTVFARLSEHVKRNRMEATVTPLQLALSNTNGTIEIAFADEQADNQGLGSIVNLDPNQVKLRETVNTQTLDDFVRQYQIEKIDLMKIDIQGAEPFLLEGGAHVFGVLGPDLLMEISPDDLKAAGTDSRKLCLKIESYGYRIHQMKRGRVARQLKADDISPDFHAINVYCTKR